ncbi:mycothione reductase [Paenarthrobacter sp. Z7-10]|uniref:mycothione reductase n=1 Tax=Paenarthrobacter sp. Z7-10 TaxID=2787635 RepID=UPI0022A9F22C|nr:mycothione reductase [Paenarthrobacter sp. Z7-10]MCZ2402338.1 mycothione reductase [Paenarthrobacter sp. Z7-10]
MTHYDLAIIGSGSGNSLPGPAWADKKVAVLDGGTFGGTCLNVGCIPTKMFVYPADLAAGTREAGRLGVDAEVRNVHWRAIRDRIFDRIDPISAGGKEYRQHGNPNTTLYAEDAHFTGPNELSTTSGARITAADIVVAAGSRPVLPDFEGNDLPQVHTSDTVMRIDELPGRVLIVGGGFIAAEFGHIFSSFGSEVTVVTRSGGMLKSQDAEISQRFEDQVRRNWTVRHGYQVASVRPLDRRDQPGQQVSSSGPVTVELTPSAGFPSEATTLTVDLVLLATGRRPNTDRLGLEATGFDVHADGRLSVDAFQRVLASGRPVKGVWALGDISSPFELKHVANHEARTVAHNLLAPSELRASDHRFVPAAVFTRPQIASVGMTELQARQHARGQGRQIVTAVQNYGTTAYGWAMEDTSGVVKLIAGKEDGQLLGAHIMGHEASLLIQPLVQAMSFGLDVKTMATGQYWIHPALTEVVENALLALEVD